MDPLSISASVAGLLTLSAAIASSIARFRSAYSIARAVHDEMLEFRAVLSQLQPLALAPSFSDVARASMIDLSQVEVTLVGSMCTFSELEREVDRLGIAGSSSVVTRVKWSFSQSKLNGLVQRLQNHKASLALMLAIMTSKTHAEAMEGMGKLQSKIEELLQRLEWAPSGNTAPSLMTGITSTGDSIRSLSSIRSSFESALLRTRLYSRILQPQSAMRSGSRNWSILSGRSISEISNITVYELPISTDELYNPYWYGDLFPAVRGGHTGRATQILDSGVAAQAQLQRAVSHALLLAVEGGHLAMTRMLLENGADTEFRDTEGNTALLIALLQANNQQQQHLGRRAAKNNYVTIINTLLAASAQTNCSNTNGDTPLHIVAPLAHSILGSTILESLLHQSPNTEKKNRVGDTALHIASKNGYIETVVSLLRYGADRSTRDSDGNSALVLASREGFTDCIQALVEAGASIDGLEEAFAAAVRGGKLGSIKFLLENSIGLPADVEIGHEALRIAAERGDIRLVDQLLKDGAGGNNKDTPDQDSVSWVAAFSCPTQETIQAYRHIEEIPLFRQQGEKLLHIAARQNCSYVVECLLSHGANVEAEDSRGDRALHIAARQNCGYIMDHLLSRGADVEAEDGRGNRALHIVALAGSEQAVEQVLDRGANVEAENRNGDRALHIAARTGRQKAVEILLKYRARTDAVDRYGNTALHLVINQDSSNIMKQLLSNGAQIEAKNINGDTVLHLAVSNGSRSCVDRLLAHHVNTAARNNQGKLPFELISQDSVLPAWQLNELMKGIPRPATINAVQ